MLFAATPRDSPRVVRPRERCYVLSTLLHFLDMIFFAAKTKALRRKGTPILLLLIFSMGLSMPLYHAAPARTGKHIKPS